MCELIDQPGRGRRKRPSDLECAQHHLEPQRRRAEVELRVALYELLDLVTCLRTGGVLLEVRAGLGLAGWLQFNSAPQPQSDCKVQSARRSGCDDHAR